jgi:hypothetical protein
MHGRGLVVATKTEAASQVRTVLQSVKDRLAQPGGARLNEATTRAHFLNPLLNALGYGGIDDLEFERPVDASLLSPRGEKRGRHYVAHPRLLELVEPIRQRTIAFNDDDPFGGVQQTLPL